VVKKVQIQKEAVDLFSKYDTIALEWATGTGKSLAAILCIEARIPVDGKKWYILCEEIKHIENWKQEFILHNKEHLLAHVEIFCYASVHKYVNTEANLVLDEAHVASDLRLSYLQTIKADKVIVLSATLPIERKQLIKKWRDFISFEVSLSDAIENGLLPEPRIYKVEIVLDNIAEKYIYQYKRGFGKKPITVSCRYSEFDAVLRKMYDVKSFIISVRCTARQSYAMYSRDMYDWKETSDIEQSSYAFRMYLQKGSARKRFLAEYKTPYVHQVLGLIGKKRLICFCGSVKQANLLGGENAVHSEITGTEKTVKKFNNFEIDEIYAVKMLRSGINLAGIESGVVVQLDSKSLTLVQMAGRIFRASDPELYILVAMNTNDEFYYGNCLQGFNEEYLKTIKLKWN